MRIKARNLFTILIVPHTEEETYSFRLPLWTIKVISAFFILLLLVLIYLVYGTLMMQEEAVKNEELQSAIRSQREEMDKMTAQTDDILKQLTLFEEFKSEAVDKIDQDTEGIFTGHEENVLLQGKNRTAEARWTEDMSRSLVNNPVISRTEENLDALNRLLPQTSEAIAELKEDVEEYKKRMDATPDIWPTRGRLTSGFGNRRDPINYTTSFHSGVDIANTQGTAIKATANGTVSFEGTRGGYGNMVVIDHGYGYETLYAHLSRTEVSEGEEVKRGDIIGRMGSTGRAVGSHLHYEVHVNGTPVDPMDYME